MNKDFALTLWRAALVRFAPADRHLKTGKAVIANQSGWLRRYHGLQHLGFLFAEIEAQGISIDLPTVEVERTIVEGDKIQLGSKEIEVWHTPGHTNGQLAFRMGNLLFSGDNIYRDGCVGNIDAHHGSDIPDFIDSLKRIQASDVEWLLPSHGPPFRKNDEQLQQTIDRLDSYQHMADFGTCAVDWPLLEAWEEELLEGFDPQKA